MARWLNDSILAGFSEPIPMKKSTLIFLLIAVAAGAAVWYFEFKREKPAETDTKTKPAFTFKEEDIAGAVITRSGEKGAETIALEKRGASWWMTKPVDSAVDSSAMDSLVYRLTSARISKTLTVEAAKLGEFGLASPKTALDVKLKSGAAHRVRFGDKDFTGSDVYAFLDDAREASVLNAELLAAVDKPLLEFRDRRVTTVKEDEIVRVRMKNKEQSLLAEKNEAGKWIVRQPAAHAGKELTATRILLTLENARADEIVDQPTSAQRSRLARPEVEIEVTAKDGKTTRYVAALESPAKPAPKGQAGETGEDSGKALFGSSATPLLFKLPKSNLDTLNFKIADVVQEPPKEEKQPEKKN
jgi:hypothetical protein